MLHYAIVVKPEECAGCRQCERLCPTVSLYIVEINIKEEKDNE
jgi:NAD-dependent dihydropyrimidine dehydrogenase PreA subunit